MTTSHWMRGGSPRTLLRIGSYYGLLLVAMLVVLRVQPEVGDALRSGSIGALVDSSLEGISIGAPAAGSAFGPGGALVTVLSLVGALALMLPVAWVYILTKQRRGYDESLVQTMIILPLAVAGIVLIVQHSLALAFSLAGIVAAVRFRSTLKDTKDAVYVFLAIGVGLASGANALGVAALLTLVFNAVILLLWQTNFGNVYADQRSRSGALGLGDVLAGVGSGATSLAVGDPQLLEAVSEHDLRDVANRAARMQRYVRAETARPKRKRLDALVIVYAKQVLGAEKSVERVLERLTSEWRMAEIVPGRGTTSVLEFLVRLKPEASAADLMEALGELPDDIVDGAEFRSLRGLK